MFNDNDLHELLELTAPNSILSLYLNTDPSEGNADAYKLRMRSMLKNIDLLKDVNAVENYFNRKYDWSGRSVAVFSCALRDFFRAYPLAIPVHNIIHVSDRPSIKPLTVLLDNYGGYGVILIDKQGARTFFFHLGELREQEGILGETVKRTKHGGSSTSPGRRGGTAGQTRYTEEIVDRNMKEAAEFAVNFFREKHIRQILIGGTDDNIALFKSQLPKAWQSLVMGSFPISMNASHAEVQSRALNIGQKAERQREEKLVASLITAAAKGSGAVVGMEETLSAVNDGRIRILVIVEGHQETGYRCSGCRLLTTQAEEVCSVCRKEIERIPDVVEVAVSRVLRNGGDIEVIYSNPVLEQAGNIGALLRY